MPGPGGGGSGGGFGGGSRGGGFGGGGFGGTRRPMRPYYGFGMPFFFGPRFYGGGCLGGLMGIFLMPVIILMLAGLLVFSSLGTAFSHVANGGVISYDARTFEAYADQQYAAEFGKGGSDAYEDNLLIVFLTNEEADGYYCIAWVGDNIQSNINLMFGNQNTVFGRAVTACIKSDYYGYSLDSNLAAVMDVMSVEIQELGLKSSFKDGTASTSTVQSHLTNKTGLSMTADTVNDSLERFTEETGIPAVIVVDTMENVFGKNLPMSSILTLILAAVLVGVAIFLIVRSIRKRKQGQAGGKEKINL